MEVYLYVFAFIMGTLIFSFLNVVIYRLPKGEDFVRGRSKCPSCGHLLSFGDMIPILSLIVLGGKCRYCGAKISIRYALVELLGGVAAAMCCVAFGFNIYTVFAFSVCCVLTCVGFIDHDTMTIPDGLNIALCIIGVLTVLTTDRPLWYEHLIGFFIISLFMLILTLVVPQAFGGGDIKLMAACGLFLGWKNAVFAFFAAILVGGIYAAVLILIGKKQKKDQISFGPFLCLGVAAAMFFGDLAIKHYMVLW